MRVDDPGLKGKLHSGEVFRAWDAVGKKTLFLYVLSEGFSAGSTDEACSSQHHLEKIARPGAMIAGVSHDLVERQGRFTQKYRLTFFLASDPDPEIARKYDIARPAGLLVQNVTCIIDNQGIIGADLYRKVLPDNRRKKTVDVPRELNRISE